MKALRKLQSNSGASILFGLLLFLVCAVIGSVVLAAGTAAGGRLSELAKMDQRYYSVTSAAELLKDTLDEQEHIIVRTRTATTTTVTTVTTNTVNVEVDGELIPTTEVTTVAGTPTTSYVYGATLDAAAVAAGSSLLGDIALNAMFGSDAQIDYESAWSNTYPAYSSAAAQNLTVTPGNAAGVDGSELAVTVTETVQPNGDIVFVLQNSDSGSDRYTVTMTFTASVEEEYSSADPTRNTAVSTSGNVTTITVTETYTETKTTTITWNLTDVR